MCCSNCTSIGYRNTPSQCLPRRSLSTMEARLVESVAVSSTLPSSRRLKERTYLFKRKSTSSTSWNRSQDSSITGYENESNRTQLAKRRRPRRRLRLDPITDDRPSTGTPVSSKASAMYSSLHLSRGQKPRLPSRWPGQSRDADRSQG